MSQTAQTKQDTTTATFHFGGEKADIPAVGSDTVAAVKAKAMQALDIVQDGNIDYPLKFEGKTVADENQTLLQLAGGKLPPKMQFQLGKVPKGG